MDIVNWDALKKGLLIRDSLESTDDLVLVAANTSYNKRGDLYQTYAVPASALGGGGGGGLSDQGIYNNAGTVELGAPTFLASSSIPFQTNRYIDLGSYFLSMSTSGGSALNISSGLGSAVTITSSFQGIQIDAGNTGIISNAVIGGGFGGTLYGVQCLSDVTGLYASGTTSGVEAISNGIPLVGTNLNTNTSSVLTTINLTRNCSPSVPVSGVGQAIDFNNPVTGPGGTSAPVSNRLISKYTNITIGTRTSQFEIHGVNNGGAVEAQVTVKGSGLVQYNKYGSATFNGTVRYLLAVDTSGNVQEVTLAGLTNAIDDAAAAAAGVPLSGIYRNGSVLQIRTV
jgi:hypothetical protein